MFKRITVILLITISLMYFSPKIHGKEQHRTNFYFDNQLSEKSYFYDANSNNYPLFEGYTFKDLIISEDTINLYYEKTKLKVIINGNGGLFNGLEEIVVKEILYGDTYYHNPLEINIYGFTKEGYRLEAFEKSFDRSVVATSDIVYYAKWQSESLDYKFIVDGEELIITQKRGDYINLPVITTHKTFIGFYDVNNNLYSSNYLINNLEPLTLIAVFDETKHDNIIHSNLIAIPKIESNNWVLLIDDQEVLGEIINNYFVFKDLDEETSYTFKNTNNHQYIRIKTKAVDNTEHVGLPKADTLKIINHHNYYHYYDDNGLISYSEFKFNPNIKYRKSFSNEELSVLRLEDITIVEDLNINLKPYNNQVLINNNSGFKYMFNGLWYQEFENLITDLDENELYYLEYEIKGVKFRKYFYTNQLVNDLTINDFKISISDNKVIIDDPYLNYEYGLIVSDGLVTNINWQAINDTKVTFYNLLPNTNYTLYIRSNLGEIDNVGSIKTLKNNIDNVIPPRPYLEVIKINENSIILKNDQNHEYSVDGINWISSNEATITLNNLASFHEYPIYLRMKETKNNVASNKVLANYLKTLAKIPDDSLLIDLFYDYKTISFSLMEGYNYYFNDELIKEKHFKIDNLLYNSVHKIMVERISDKKTFILNLKLKTTSNLTDDEKEVLIEKDDSGIKILSKANFKYILKLADKTIETIAGDGRIITFDVSSNETYQLYLLKAANNDHVYLEEYVKDIYLAPNLSILLNNYVKEVKYQNNSSIKKIIIEQTKLAYSLNDLEAFNELYENAKLLIDNEISNLKANRNQKIIIIAGSILATIVIRGFLVIYKKRKKVEL